MYLILDLRLGSAERLPVSSCNGRKQFAWSLMKVYPRPPAEDPSLVAGEQRGARGEEYN